MDNTKSYPDIVPMPDQPEWGISDIFLINNSIEVYRHKVIYGYRLQARHKDDLSVIVNICCGPGKEQYETVRNLVMLLISNNIAKGKDPFTDVPTHSEIKPWYNDDDFCENIERLTVMVGQDIWAAAYEVFTSGLRDYQKDILKNLLQGKANNQQAYILKGRAAEHIAFRSEKRSEKRPPSFPDFFKEK